MTKPWKRLFGTSLLLLGGCVVDRTDYVGGGSYTLEVVDPHGEVTILELPGLDEADLEDPGASDVPAGVFVIQDNKDERELDRGELMFSQAGFEAFLDAFGIEDEGRLRVDTDYLPDPHGTTGFRTGIAYVCPEHRELSFDDDPPEGACGSEWTWSEPAVGWERFGWTESWELDPDVRQSSSEVRPPRTGGAVFGPTG